MSTAERKPWEFPPVVQTPVVPSEVRSLISEAQRNRVEASEQSVHVEYPEDILRLNHGTGYYQRRLREGEKPSLSDIIRDGFTYFGIDLGRVQLLGIPNIRGVAYYVRATEKDEDMRYLATTEWYMFTESYPVPMDRLRLMSEISQHA